MFIQILVLILLVSMRRTPEKSYRSSLGGGQPWI